MMDYEMDGEDEKPAPYDSVISEDSLSTNRDSYQSDLAGPSRQTRKMEELFPWIISIDNEFRYILKISWCRRRLLLFMTKYIQVIRDNLPTFIHYPNRCFVMARYMSKCMFLFKELFNSFADSNEYLVRICEMLITYTLLELKHAVKFNTSKTSIADRIAMNYDIHLKSVNISYLLRVFMELPTFFQQKEVMSKIFEKYLKKPETFVKKELPDKLFVMYIVAFKLWRSVESDEFAKDKIDNIAHRYMYPKSTLQKNRRYAPFLPNYETVEDAAITILKKSFSLVGLVAAIKAEDMDINPENVIDLSEETRALSIVVDDDEESENVDSDINIKRETIEINQCSNDANVGENRQKFEVEWIEFFVNEAIDAEPLAVRLPISQTTEILDTIILDESDDEDAQEKLSKTPTTKEVESSEKETPPVDETAAEIAEVVPENPINDCENEAELSCEPIMDNSIDIISTNEIINEVIVETTEEEVEVGESHEFEDIITTDIELSTNNTSKNVESISCTLNDSDNIIQNKTNQNVNNCDFKSEGVKNICELLEDNEKVQNKEEVMDDSCNENSVYSEDIFFDHTSIDHNYEVVTSVISSVVSDDSCDSEDENDSPPEKNIIIEDDELPNPVQKLQDVANKLRLIIDNDDIEVVNNEVETILVDDNDDDEENCKDVKIREQIEISREDSKSNQKNLAQPTASVQRRPSISFRHEVLIRREGDINSLNLPHDRFNENNDSLTILSEVADSVLSLKKSSEEKRRSTEKSNPSLNVLFSGKIVPLNINSSVSETKSTNSSNVVFSMCRKTNKRKVSSYSDVGPCNSIFNSITEENHDNRFGVVNIDNRLSKSPNCRETIRKSNSIRSPSTYKSQDSRHSRNHNDFVNSNEISRYNYNEGEDCSKEINRPRRVSFNELPERHSIYNNININKNSEDSTINFQHQNHHQQTQQQATLSNNQHKHISPGFRCNSEINNCSIRVIDSAKSFYRNDERQLSSFCDTEFFDPRFSSESDLRYHVNKHLKKRLEEGKISKQINRNKKRKRRRSSQFELQKKRSPSTRNVQKDVRKSQLVESDFDKYLAKLKEKQNKGRSTASVRSNKNSTALTRKNDLDKKEIISEDPKLNMIAKVVLPQICPHHYFIRNNVLKTSHQSQSQSEAHNKQQKQTEIISKLTEFKTKKLRVRIKRCNFNQFKQIQNPKESNKINNSSILPNTLVPQSIQKMIRTANLISVADSNENIDCTAVSKECSSNYCHSKLVQKFLDVPLIQNMLLQISKSENCNIRPNSSSVNCNNEAINRNSISSERENEVSSTQETYRSTNSSISTNIPNNSLATQLDTSVQNDQVDTSSLTTVSSNLNREHSKQLRKSSTSRKRRTVSASSSNFGNDELSNTPSTTTNEDIQSLSTN